VKNKKETLSRSDKEFVKEYFSLERIAMKTAETYQQLVKKHRNKLENP